MDENNTAEKNLERTKTKPDGKGRGTLINVVAICAVFLAIRRTGTAGSNQSKTRMEPDRPRGTWGIIAAVAFLSGASIPLFSASCLVEDGTTPEKLVSYLTVFVVISVLVTGVGQLMCAAVHGTGSLWGKRIDGWGKIFGVFGWSLGLIGVVMFAIQKSGELSWLVDVSMATLAFASVLTLALSIASKVCHSRRA